MNIYYYLFYKLSAILNKSGKNEWGPIAAITLLISLNIGMIYINVLPVTNKNFNTGHKTILVIIFFSLYLLNTILFLNKRRFQKIKSRFEDETRKSNKMGSFLVILYIIITFISIFIG